MLDIPTPTRIGKTDDCPSIVLENEEHHDRTWWEAERRRQGTDWPSLWEVASGLLANLFANIEVDLFETDLLKAENTQLRAELARFRKSEVDRGDARLWPTPRVTIESVLCAVRERGLSALREPKVQQRLRECDEAAKAEVNRRIEKLGLRHD